MKRSKVNIDEFKLELNNWIEDLPYLDKAESTKNVYMKSVKMFNEFLETSHTEFVDKLDVIRYREYLQDLGYSNSTVNLRVTVINRLFKDMGYPDIKVDLLEDETSNVLTNIPTEKDYKRMLEWADRLGKPKIKLIMETLTATGLRISELQYLKKESLKNRYFKVTNKGKTRFAFIPKRLKNKLMAYCRENDIKSGIIFHAEKLRIKRKDGESEKAFNERKQKLKENTPLDQSYIRREMLIIGGKARGNLRSKCHPHALRHLFAIRYSNTPGTNPYWLSDILGHSTKNRATTTDLYARGSTNDYLRTVDAVEEYYFNLTKKNK